MSTKYKFILKNIDLPKVHTNYGIKLSIENNIQTTMLADLYKPRSDIISFLDEAKKPHVCNLSMVDMSNGIEVSFFNKHNCFWCRHPFNTKGVGCPIKYMDSQAVKTYYSPINKNTYTIKENISERKAKQLKVKPGTYITDGIFCSFNCCQSWINDNKHNRLYDLSKTLLLKLYKDMTNKKITEILPAPHWRILDKYTGDINITEFRDGFNKIEYEYHGTIITNTLGKLYEKKIKF
jgi:hypothetical protein